MKVLNLKQLSIILMMMTGISISAQTVVEDFENGDFSKLNWQFEGTPNSWQIEEVSFGDGTYSASPNAIAFNDYVYMTVQRTFTEPGQITFDIQQTEDNVFIFEIENVISMTSPGWIVGTDLRQETYDVPAGTYKIRFGSYNVGYFGEDFTMRDSLFIDNIAFPNQPYEHSAVVQLIHNSSDVLAGVVDIYLGNELILDNLAYRTATPFIDFPAGQDVVISVKGSNSTPQDDALWSNTYNLEIGEKYILIAEGLVGDSSGYDPYVPFDIAVYPQARQAASDNSKVDILVHHGATDAPIVDVVETGVGAGLLVDDLAYGGYDGYLEVDVNDYQLAVLDETGSLEVAKYYTPLAGLELGGAAITVVASGFMNPSVNSDGAPFKLLVCGPEGGSLIDLPIMSALDGETEDFETGDLNKFNWRFEGDNMNSWQITESANGSGMYVATAKHDAFNDNQTMYVYGDFQQGGTLQLDMWQTIGGSVTIVDVGDSSFSYLEFNDTPQWESLSYNIPSGVQRIAITNYVIGVFGETWSGQNDSVLIDNIRFNTNAMTQTARVQVIHNSADAAASVVDVWLNDQLLLDDFKFRTASPFVDAPAGEAFTIAIQPSNSTGPENPIWSQNYTLAEGETYILVADGLISSGYQPFQPFDIAVYPARREVATMGVKTDMVIHHGSTDAPVIDIYETGVGAGELINNLAYSNFSDYLELTTMDYVIEVRDETGNNTVATFDVPLQTLGLQGAAITVVASGFLNPSQNNDGAGFEIFVAGSAGGEMIPLPASNPSGFSDVIAENGLSVYPNPTTDHLKVNLQLKQDENVSLEIYDLTGKVVKKENLGLKRTISNYNIDLTNLTEGMYVFRLNAGKESITKKLILTK